MGSGGETSSCPVLGCKVTQSRSCAIALLAGALVVCRSGAQTLPRSSLVAQLAEGAGLYLVTLFLRAKASAALGRRGAVLGSGAPGC